VKKQLTKTLTNSRVEIMIGESIQLACDDPLDEKDSQEFQDLEKVSIFSTRLDEELSKYLDTMSDYNCYS